MNGAREAGYRWLGPRLDYFLHLRPLEWPIVAAHTAVGYLLAVDLDGAARGEQLGPALLGLGFWVVCLNGGTLALNSAYDRDEGDIAYLRDPPPPPRGLAPFALLLMAAGQVGALVLPPAFQAAYAICVILSLLYSVPPVRLKAVAGADWVINMVGFGSLTPFAGWAATGRGLTGAETIVLLAFCPLFAALYPLTQLYQLDEDTRRGDRTLARLLGMRRSLDAALITAAAAFALFAWAGLRSGWSSEPGSHLRWGALGLAFAAWVAVLVPWRIRVDAHAPAAHQRGMYRALAAWALTDAAVVVAWAA